MLAGRTSTVKIGLWGRATGIFYRFQTNRISGLQTGSVQLANQDLASFIQTQTQHVKSDGQISEKQFTVNTAGEYCS